MRGTWVFSPDPEVESAVEAVRRDFPPLMPAGLPRVRDYLSALGDPQLKQPGTVFHVAGTNGKGSVVAFLKAALEAAGKTAHVFISPHLVRFEERIQPGGQHISRDALLSLIGECRRAAAGRQVSFFEFFTALGFLAFSRAPADAVLLETGLGGLLDATNVVPETVGIITRVSYDHMHILGATLPEIVAQKAGICREGRPVVIAPQHDEGVMTALTRDAVSRGAFPFASGTGWSAGAMEEGFVYDGRKYAFSLPLPALKGAHQVENAGAAIAALEVSGMLEGMTRETVSAGIASATWPGRLQRLESGPMLDFADGGREIWLDGAHNVSGAETIARQVRAWGDGPVDLVTTVKKGKEAAGFFAALEGAVARVRVLDADIGAEMQDPQDLAAELRAAGFKDVRIVETLETAVGTLPFQSGSARRILVAGSLYLAGYVLRSHS